MPTVLLLDNTILSNFGQVNRPDVLFDLWGAIMYTTNPVMAEYRNGIISRSLAPKAWESLALLEPEPTEITFGAQLPGDLGDGERSCLAIAIPRRGWIATDDLRARLVAKQYGIGVTGTIGAFQEALKHQILDVRHANALLKKMIAAGYRSPVDDLGKI
jgi:predicted nucleic acid-binding protein